MSHSVKQPLHSPVSVIRTLTIELEVVWPAIPYFVPQIACIAASTLDALASAYALARHCHSVAVSQRLKFTLMVLNEYPFVDQQNPCANSCCLDPTRCTSNCVCYSHCLPPFSLRICVEIIYTARYTHIQ